MSSILAKCPQTATIPALYPSVLSEFERELCFYMISRLLKILLYFFTQLQLKVYLDGLGFRTYIFIGPNHCHIDEPLHQD